MLIDGFVDGKIAITIRSDGSIRIPEDLVILEREIDEATGYHVSVTTFASGFAEYCIKILEYVSVDARNNGIEVVMDNGVSFGYMPAGTTYYQNEGLKVVDAVEFLDEAGARHQPLPPEKDFFEVLM